MAKLTKEKKITYGLIAAASVVAIWLYLPQDTPPTAHHTILKSSSASDAPVYDPAADTNVHFAKYLGSGRDPFVPGVQVTSGLSSASGKLAATGKWQLTGINTIDGTTSALIENSATNQTVFVKVGDSWNGLRVASIGEDTVDFINALGQPSQLGFTPPPDPNIPSNNGLNVYSPSISQITPLPALSPDAAPDPSQTFTRRGRRADQ